MLPSHTVEQSPSSSSSVSHPPTQGPVSSPCAMSSPARVHLHAIVPYVPPSVIPSHVSLSSSQHVLGIQLHVKLSFPKPPNPMNHKIPIIYAFAIQAWHF